jgi:2-iminobutanoate/2-iminopropanoate deaminase
MKEPIVTTAAPAALGPYSQAIAAGETLYCAGQIPLDPATGELVGHDVATQTRRVLENLHAVLAGNNMGFEHVLKTTVFMTNLGDFGAMNAVYSDFFPAPYPARSTVQVAALPRGAQVEIEAIASRA